MNLKFWEKSQREREQDALIRDLNNKLDSIQNESVSLAELTNWGQLWGDVATSASGQIVNADTAMRHSAVYGCVRILATVVSMLPLHVYEKKSNGDREQVQSHPLWHLLNFEAAPGVSPLEMWEQTITNKFLRGNGYICVDRTVAGEPIALRPRASDRVEPIRLDEDTKIYRYQDFKGKIKAYHQDDMLHFPCVGYDGLKGIDPISHAGRSAIGTALAQDEYAAQFFKNGAVPTFGIEYPDNKKVSAEQAKVIQQFVVDRTTGENRHHPLVVAEGATIKELSISAEAAQVLQSRAFSVGDIARLFGVPLWLLQQTEKNTSWGSGIEQMSIGAIIYTFAPLLRKLESIINLKLLGSERGKIFVEFNIDALQRGDFKARIDALTKALGGNNIPGFMAPDEVRRKLNLPSLGEGYDKPYKPQANESDSMEPETDPEEPNPETELEP